MSGTSYTETRFQEKISRNPKETQVHENVFGKWKHLRK